MATISELNIRLGLLTKEFDRNLAKVERDLRASGTRMSRLGSDLTLAISAPLAAFGGAAIKAAGDQEALTLALENQLGTAEAARKEYEALRKEALKPGLGLEQALKGSVSLQAVGFSADNARRTLSNFGNALALAGKGKAELDGVALALTQISAKGKVSAEEINQLAERLPQIRKLMKDAFGTADTEALQKMGITSQQFIEAINKELEKLPQATGGIKNSIENAGDAINQFLAGIGNEINKTFDLKTVAENIGDSLGGALQWFQQLDDGTKKTVVQMGLFAVAVGPVIKVIGVMKSTVAEGIGLFRDMVGGLKSLASGALNAISAFQGLSTAMKFTVAGAALVAVTALYFGFQYLSENMFKASAAAQAVAEVNQKAAASIAKEKTEVDLLVRTLNTENASRDEKKKALDRLKQTSPQYFGQLKEEDGLIKGLKTAYDSYIQSLLQSARAAAAREKLIDVERQLLDIETTKADKLKQAQKASALVGVNYEQTAKAFNRQINEQIKPLEEQKKALADIVAQTENYDKAVQKTTTTTNGFTAATGDAGDGLSKKMKTALASVNSSLSAFDEKLKLYDTTAENAQKRNDLLAASIDRLLGAGLPATSEQVQRLRGELLASTSITETVRKKYEALGGAFAATAGQTKGLSDASGALGNSMGAGVAQAISEVNANLAAFDAQVKAYAPSAENAQKRNDLLAASIDRLLGAGLPATSEQVQQLRGELLASTSITETVRKKYEALGGAVGTAAGQTQNLVAATGALGNSLGADVAAVIAEVNTNLAAFDAQVKTYAPAAETAEARNDLLAKSIDRLLKAGFSATSEQVQKLKNELAASKGVTDDTREAYEKLRAEWSKPVDLKVNAPAVPTLPQANPLGVSSNAPTPGVDAPQEVISVSAMNESLIAINAVTAGLQNLTTAGLTPAQAIMQGLRNDTLTFTEAYAAMAEHITSTGPVVAQIALGIGQSFEDAANSGAKSFSDFAREFIKSAAKIIRTQIQIAVTNAALSALESAPAPYNLILAGVAGAAAGALFNALVNKITAPKLAGGGVITKPTFALLGEYPGAGSNPEIATPERKLRSIFRSENAGGGGPVEIFGTIRGSDIFVSNKKAERDRGRVR